MTTLAPTSTDPHLDVPHVPVLRWGKVYESLDAVRLVDHRDGSPLADVGQANAGIIRRDMRQADERVRSLRDLTCDQLIGICEAAGELFMHGTLPLGANGETQSPQDYVDVLSATSGLPHVLCRRNMQKAYTVLTEMRTILLGLTRGLDPGVIDEGISAHDGMPLSFASCASSLGVVLPSNSPGVNSIWMPAIPLKVPVILKPGREEPWTPLRLLHALIAAGCPHDAFGFYPTDHEGAATMIECTSRSLVFGNAKTTAPYAGDPTVEVHGPGWSKVIIGPDEIAKWRDHLDVLISSIVDNGGRSCINASCIVVPSHGAEIAEALARVLAPLEPTAAEADDARLSAHANPTIAAAIDRAIDATLEQGGATEVTERHRSGPRLVEFGGATFLRPTIIHCDSTDHPLANTEYMFPFASVVEVEPDRMLDFIGPTLVVSAITRDRRLREALVESPHVERLNMGPVPTTRVDWDQPHEGNLFEFLYSRRAIHQQSGW